MFRCILPPFLDNGIDTPEMRPSKKTADGAGRIVADVEIGGVDLGDHLVELGKTV